MPTEPAPTTISEVVHRAVEVCDDGSDSGLDELLERFEDDDEPIAAIQDLPARLDMAIGPQEFDEDDRDAPMTMARAVILYLAHRRDELNGAPGELLRLAARAEFDGHPPDYVSRWLEQQGIEV